MENDLINFRTLNPEDYNAKKIPEGKTRRQGRRLRLRISCRRILKEFFKAKGYNILEAENGKKALGLAGREKISVVLLDIHMLVMDGLETLRRLKEINPKLGVVMVTGVQDDDKVKEAVELGVYGYVLKPFDFLYLDLAVMSKLAIAESG